MGIHVIGPTTCLPITMTISMTMAPIATDLDRLRLRLDPDSYRLSTGAQGQPDLGPQYCMHLGYSRTI